VEPLWEVLVLIPEMSQTFYSETKTIVQPIKFFIMKKELVKSSPIEDRVAKEVESLCDGFSCSTFTGWPAGDAGGDSEILF
jgi:hypothetical protein